MKTTLIILEIFEEESLRELALINGRMASSTTDSGLTAKWKVLENFHGQMALSIEANSQRIDFMDKVSIDTEMEGYTSVGGEEAFNMEKES